MPRVRRVHLGAGPRMLAGSRGWHLLRRVRARKGWWGVRCRTCHTRPVTTGYEASGECLGCYWGLTPQSQAATKRARKAAKREEDARRTAEGRVWSKNVVDVWSPPTVPRGIWDKVELYIRHGGSGAVTIRWRQRLNHRRSLPWVGRAWDHWGSQAMRAWRRRLDRFDAEQYW